MVHISIVFLFQVENTTLKSKCASLGSEKSDLQTQLNNIEIEHDALIQRQEDLSSKKDALSVDYEKLQHLHKQLSLEYEALISEHGSLKSIHKAMKSELKDTKEQLDTFLQVFIRKFVFTCSLGKTLYRCVYQKMCVLGIYIYSSYF